MDQSKQPEPGNQDLVELRVELGQLRHELAEVRAVCVSALEEARSQLQVQIANSEAKLRRHTTGVASEGARQMEAMWQLFPKVPRMRAPMPPSGGFPMEAGTLLHLSAILENVRPKTILELGGGTSTIWMGYLTEELGTRIVSVDHHEDYLKSTSDHVDRHGFSDRIECRLAPLEQVTVEEDAYSW